MAAYYFPLTTAHVFDARGPDAVRYLNGRLSNDISLVDESVAQVSAALSAQGRVLGLFRIVRKGPDNYLLFCDGGSVDDLLGALLQFKVADQVDIRVDEELNRVVHVSQSLLEDAGSGLSEFTAVHDQELRVFRHQGVICISSDRGFGLGADLICTAAVAETLLQTFAKAGVECASTGLQLCRRLAHGIPVYPEEINAALFFPEACMPGAISTTKGCYVGQEAVEMVTARGKLAGRLMRIEAQGGAPVESGSAVELVDTDAKEGRRGIGKVISGVADAELGACYYIARIRKIDSASGLPVLVGAQSGRLFSL